MCRIKAATRFALRQFQNPSHTLALSDSLKEVCRSFPSSIQARTVTKTGKQISPAGMDTYGRRCAKLTIPP